jgi:hypothetical protein
MQFATTPKDASVRICLCAKGLLERRTEPGCRVHLELEFRKPRKTEKSLALQIRFVLVCSVMYLVIQCYARPFTFSKAQPAFLTSASMSHHGTAFMISVGMCLCCWATFRLL